MKLQSRLETEKRVLYVFQKRHSPVLGGQLFARMQDKDQIKDIIHMYEANAEASDLTRNCR